MESWKRLKKKKRIPDEILTWEILPRLPAKVLAKFRCVSKLWRKMINDVIEERRKSQFILARSMDSSNQMCVKVFNQSLNLIKKLSVELPGPFLSSYEASVQSGSGLGVLGFNFGMSIICNAATEEFIALPVTDGSEQCMAIARAGDRIVIFRFSDSHCQVLTLGDSHWRDARTRPPYTVSMGRAPYLHGGLHFLPSNAPRARQNHFISVLTVLTEDFGTRIELPEEYFRRPTGFRSLADLRGSISFSHTVDYGKSDARIEVFVLNDYCKNVWGKEYDIPLYKLTTKPGLVCGVPADPVALLEDGTMLIIVSGRMSEQSSKLVLYDPQEQDIIRQVDMKCSVVPFTETMVPLASKVGKYQFLKCSIYRDENWESSVLCERCGDPKPRFRQCTVCTSDNVRSSLHYAESGVLGETSNNSGNIDSNLEAFMMAYNGDEEEGIKYLLNDEISDSSSTGDQNNETRSTARKDKGMLSKDDVAKQKRLASNLGSLKFKNSAFVTKANSLAKYNFEKWIPEQGRLNQLNLAIVGDTGSGKTTLSGRLLNHFNQISKKETHNNDNEDKEKGKGSFAYAWSMYKSAEERERDVPVSVDISYFKSKNFHVVLLDFLGDKDFVSKMISGVTQADTAIIVVDASVGSFKSVIDGYGAGRTMEHALFIRSFGVEQVIVAINKMDIVEFSKKSFEFIKSQLGSLLCFCFKHSAMTWIPVSSTTNQNLVTAPSDARLTSWYHGLCLLDAINTLQCPLRAVSKPLCLPILYVTKSNSGQLLARGKLEAGDIENGSRVMVLPSGQLATVESMDRDSCPCSIARAGDNVVVCLKGVDRYCVMPGGVLCHPDSPVQVSATLELKIIVFDIRMPIMVGSKVDFHIHHTKEEATVVKILSLLDPKTCEVIENFSSLLKSKECAIVEVVLGGAVCVENFSNCRVLGRAILRRLGSTIACGVVTRVIKET